jgi:hypothetical protein
MPQTSQSFPDGASCPWPRVQQKRGWQLARNRHRRLLLLLALYSLLIAIPAYFGWAALFMKTRAAWLWNPQAYFQPAKTEQLLRACDEWRIRTLFAQVRLNAISNIDQQEEWRLFLKSAAARRIHVYALAGEPAWAQAHSSASNVVHAVSSFNRGTHPGFAGVQFDVEPHLLPEYATSPTQVLREWLGFVDTTSKEAHDLGLTIGYAIPPWLNERLEFNGARAPLYQHVMDRADHVALMAYTSALEGTDGLTSLSGNVRNYSGSHRGAAAVWLGVDLTTGTQRLARFVCSTVAPGNPSSLPPEISNYQVRLLHLGRIFLLGVSAREPSEVSPSQVLLQIATGAQFPTTSEPEVIEAAQRELHTTGEYKAIRALPAGQAFGKPLVLVTATEQSATTATFHGRTRSEFTKFLGRAERRLVDSARVQGIALHDFENLPP